MIRQKKVVLVLPAYNAAETLRMTYREIPSALVDEVILVDDGSEDQTVEIARELGIQHIILHEENKGYGANQKSCYREALALDADIVVMLHPDYQYPPALIPAMVSMIAYNQFQVVYGSRILGNEALKGKMPIYKYVANRLLTFIQNVCMRQKLSEYHTGFRAYSAEVLNNIDLSANSDDFVFDNQITAQIFYAGYAIGEVTSTTRYFREASSINFFRSIRYGMGVLKTTLQYMLQKSGMCKFAIFKGVKRKPGK